MNSDIYDGHFDDEHRVLRNTLHLTDPQALEIAIADLSRARLVELQASPVKGKFDIPHIRAIHRYIFQDIFPWAGDFRTVTTARTGSFSFPPPIYIESSLQTISNNIRTENHLKHLDPNTFALRAAHYLNEINAVHPSAKATAALSASSSAPWRSPPAIVSSGPTSRKRKTTKPPASATPPATAPN